MVQYIKLTSFSYNVFALQTSFLIIFNDKINIIFNKFIYDLIKFMLNILNYSRAIELCMHFSNRN